MRVCDVTRIFGLMWYLCVLCEVVMGTAFSRISKGIVNSYTLRVSNEEQKYDYREFSFGYPKRDNC